MKQALAEPEKQGLAGDQQLYALPVLWKILQDSYKNESDMDDGEIRKIALDAMNEILVQ